MSDLLKVGAVCLALALSGCDTESKVLKAPNLVIAPGYIKLDSGSSIQVLGFEDCPDKGYMLIGRLPAGHSQRNCVLVRKGSKNFDILVGTSKGMIVERWVVRGESDALRLVRPNGDAATILRAKSG